jgi:dTDP-4-amino-4,6-dideoxygalactose transaminase
MSIEKLYWARLGCGLSDIIKGMIHPSMALPKWLQFEGRIVIPTYKGRVALWLLCKIWNLTSNDEVLMPAYNCGTEIDPFLSYGVKVIFYRVDRNAVIDFEDICRRTTKRTRVIYLTHYFGWSQETRHVLDWCRQHDILLVEDCALSLFSSGKEGRLGTIGNAAIFSLTKFFPIPDGGLLVLRKGQPFKEIVLKRPPLKLTCRSTLTLLINNLLKSRWISNIREMRLYIKARKLKSKFKRIANNKENNVDFPDMPNHYYFDPVYKSWSISSQAVKILQQWDPQEITERRRQNYLQLYRLIKDVPGCEPLYDELADSECPLYFPAIVSRRSSWVKCLNAFGIPAFSSWMGYHRGMSWVNFPEAKYLKDHLLQLPIHQDLDFRHMQFIGAKMKYLTKHVIKKV